MAGKSGMEMLGLGGFGGIGEVMKAAKGIADSGVVEKLLKFAGEVEHINARLTEIEQTQHDIVDCLARLLGRLPSPADGADGLSGGGGIASSAADGEHRRLEAAD